MPASNRSLTILVGVTAAIMLGWVLHVGASILRPLVIALLLATGNSPLDISGEFPVASVIFP